MGESVYRRKETGRWKNAELLEEDEVKEKYGRPGAT